MGNSTVGDGLEPVDTAALAAQMLADASGNQPSDTGDNSTENEDDTDSGDNSGKLGGHPAWQEVLAAVPAEYHDALAPKLKEWDAGVTRRFQEIHSQYEPLKVYEPLVEQEIDPDDLSRALGLYQALNNDPRQVYEALGSTYGFVAEQGSSDDDDDDYDSSDNYRLPPEIQQQLNEQQLMLERMAEYFQQQEMTVQQQAEQAELDNYLGALSQQYGEFDEDYVLTKMAAGVDGELAVREYQSKFPVGALGTPTGTQPPPTVIGSSGAGRGGVPSTSPQVTQLSSKETKDLVAEMLRKTAEQNQ